MIILLPPFIMLHSSSRCNLCCLLLCFTQPLASMLMLFHFPYKNKKQNRQKCCIHSILVQSLSYKKKKLLIRRFHFYSMIVLLPPFIMLHSLSRRYLFSLLLCFNQPLASMLLLFPFLYFLVAIWYPPAGFLSISAHFV